MATQTDGVESTLFSTEDENNANAYQQLIGEWVPIETLDTNDFVKVAAPFVDSTVGIQVQLAKGMIGRVRRIDEEGDAEVHFPSISALIPRERIRWILAGSFRHLLKLDET